jgi:hypothetical protein
LLPDFVYPVYALWFSKKTKGPKQDSQNQGARKSKGLNRIDKIKGSKQDSQNLGARKPKGLNRIDKIWEQENHLSPRCCISCLGPLVYLLPDYGYPV